MPCQKIQVDFVQEQNIQITFTIPGADLAGAVSINTARNTGTVSIHEDVDHSTPPEDGQVLMWDETIPAYRPRIKHKLDGTTAPGSGDDDADGFEAGSRWIDTVAEKEYVCIDASTGTAVWVETTSQGVGDMTKADYDTADNGAIDLEAGGLNADISGFDGLIRISSGATSEIKCNLGASVAPTSTDDSAAGYSLLSFWLDTTSDEAYICLDPTTSGAVWVKAGSATGFLEAVVDDTSPQLGGDLDLNSNEIKVQRYATTGEQIGFYSSTTLLGYIRHDTGVMTISGPQLLKLDSLSEIELNGGLSGVDINAPFGGITIDAGGIDGVKVQGLKYPASDGSAGQYLKTDGAGTLSFDTPSASVPSATESAQGIAEIATQAETDGGADDARIVTPAKLAASYAGKKSVMLIFLGAGLEASTGDGKVKLQITEDLEGMDLVTAKGHVDGSGTTGTMDITLYNETQALDMLSSAISIASGGTDASGTVNASNANVTDGDIISVNVDSIHTSPATGFGWVVLTFQLP